MINELFEEEGQSIFSFKQGDLIIRTKNAQLKQNVSNSLLGVDAEVSIGISTSFRTEPVEFIAVENNVIYLRSLDRFLGKKYIYKVIVEDYSENWKLFKVPSGLTLEDCI